VDKESVNKTALEYGLVLSSAALERIIEEGAPYEGLFKKAKEESIWFVTTDYLDKTVTSEKKDVCIEKPGDSSRPPKACEIESILRIHEESDVSGKSTCSGKIEDFIGYFRTRYANIREIIKERPEYKAPSTIEQVKTSGQKERHRIIVLISGRRESTRGYRFIDAEDETGQITILAPENNEQVKAAFDRLLPDEVVGVEGVYSGDLFIANDITQPDIPINHMKRYAKEEVYAAFLSDIHVGSYLFLEKEFQSFIDWLNGRGGRREVADRLKYIFIAGDLVDGIGIYPDQERELTIPDIDRQYDFLAMLLEEIPKHIHVVASVGNHDASRKAEPQPKVAKDLSERLHKIENVRVCGNPVRFSAHGVEILMYHGTSLDTIISSLSGCSYKSPETAMIELLKRRHLVPTYGSDSISPEDHDFLGIPAVPDVFHCGHVHTNGYTQYRGVTVVNSGTWQAKTAFQERLGHQPTPAIVPVMNLQNHEMMMLDFSTNNE
jgi:DNA polymerase II small subunit